MEIRRTAAPLGDALWEVRAEGLMLSRNVQSAWPGLHSKAKRGIVVDHTRTLFAVTAVGLVDAVKLGALAPVPVAYVLRPDTLPIYSLLTAHLGRHGFRRRAFLCRQDALAWVAQQAA